MPALRCSLCLTNWPQEGAFARCPKCEERTELMSSAKSLPLDEAWSLKRHADFERWLAAEPEVDRLAREDAALRADAEMLAGLEEMMGRVET